jgi:hypothetical protein
MAKRFIDTDLFRKPFMRSLEAPYKALWIYLLCECDHAGIWTVEMDIAQIRMGMKLDPAKAIEKLGGAAVPIDGGKKWYLPDFVEFQYGTLKADNRVHASVIALLSKHGIDPENKPLLSPFQGAKDKEKDKDMVKDKDFIQEGKERAHEPEIIPAGVSVELWDALKRWGQYRKEKGNKLTPTGRAALLKKCLAMGDARSLAAIDHSIAQGWTGMYEPKEQQTNGKSDSFEDYTQRVAANFAEHIARKGYTD